MRTAFVVLLLAAAAATVYGQQCSGVLPGTNPFLKRWPYLLSTTESSTIVVFGTTLDITVASVQVSLPDGGAVHVHSEATYVPIEARFVELNLFRTKITGLAPKTTYCYNLFANVTGEGQIELAGSFHFTTAPAANSTETIRFVAIGDFGAGTPGQKDIRDAIKASRFAQADLFLALGDDVYLTGTHWAYQKFNFETYNEMWSYLPLYACAGNHDVYANGGSAYVANYPQFLEQPIEDKGRGRYFSFDWGMAHFVSIDTEHELDDPEGQLAFLDRDLAASTKPWKIAMLHKTPYNKDNVADSRVVEHLVPLFEKYGVQVLLGGHWHDYQRYPPLVGQTVVPTTEGGVTYIVTGGGGFPVIGDMIPQREGKELGFRYDPRAVSHNDKDDMDVEAMRVVGPVFRKAVQHFSYVEITECDFTIQAIDSYQEVFDEFSISRC